MPPGMMPPMSPGMGAGGMPPPPMPPGAQPMPPMPPGQPQPGGMPASPGMLPPDLRQEMGPQPGMQREEPSFWERWFGGGKESSNRPMNLRKPAANEEVRAAVASGMDPRKQMKQPGAVEGVAAAEAPPVAGMAGPSARDYPSLASMPDLPEEMATPDARREVMKELSASRDEAMREREEMKAKAESGKDTAEAAGDMPWEGAPDGREMAMQQPVPTAKPERRPPAGNLSALTKEYGQTGGQMPPPLPMPMGTNPMPISPKGMEGDMPWGQADAPMPPVPEVGDTAPQPNVQASGDYPPLPEAPAPMPLQQPVRDATVTASPAVPVEARPVDIMPPQQPVEVGMAPPIQSVPAYLGEEAARQAERELHQEEQRQRVNLRPPQMVPSSVKLMPRSRYANRRYGGHEPRYRYLGGRISTGQK